MTLRRSVSYLLNSFDHGCDALPNSDAHRDEGIASAAALDALARDPGVRRFYATVDPANTRSSRLLERLGFAAIASTAYPHGGVTPGDLVYTRAAGQA